MKNGMEELIKSPAMLLETRTRRSKFCLKCRWIKKTK
jgi:hypothetical protein